MLTWLIMPKRVPASSPCDRLTLLDLVTASLPQIFTLLAVPEACITIEMLGKGTGTKGAGGAGTLHTSGKARHCPPPLEDAGNIVQPPAGAQAR